VKRGPDMFGSKAAANATDFEADDGDVEEAAIDEDDEEAAQETQPNAYKNGAKMATEGR